MSQPIILFDLDGTLIDSTRAILSCFEESFIAFNRPVPDPQRIKSLIGHPLDVMYADLGVEADRVWDFVDCYKALYRERSCAMTTLLPRAKEAIEEAATFARLGIVTTKTGEYSQILLEHMGVIHYFEALIGREHVQNPKPHPEPIFKALEEMRVKQNDSIWMIGDTCLDLIAAKRAGVRSIGVLSGYATRDELEACQSEVLQKETLFAIKYIKNSNQADIKS